MEMRLSHRWDVNKLTLNNSKVELAREKSRVYVKTKEATPSSGLIVSFDDWLSKICFFIFVYYNNFLTQVVHADSMSGLNDVFNTDAFVGNTKWLEKFNWVGELVQKCITVFGLLIAVILFSQILITIIYFAARPFWDSVAQVKESETGILNYSYATFSNVKGNVSRGSDIVMNYLHLLMPNIKKYSEMGSEEAQNKNWTFTTWLIGTFPSKCFLMLIVSMTINGTLMQAYMMVVDGMGVVAERFVDFNSEEVVNGLLNNFTEGYSFAVGSTGVGYDKTMGNVANSMYKDVLKKLKDTTTDSKITVGTAIENYVNTELSKELVQSKVMPAVAADSPLTEDEWGKLKVETVMNNVPSATNAVTVSAGNLQLSNIGSQNLYIHIYFTLSSRSNSTNYWKLNTGD